MRQILKDLCIDVIGGLLVAIGVYNFAVASGFPVAGISGIAVIFHHFCGIPIGIMTNIFNIILILWLSAQTPLSITVQSPIKASETVL